MINLIHFATRLNDAGVRIKQVTRTYVLTESGIKLSIETAKHFLSIK